MKITRFLFQSIVLVMVLNVAAFGQSWNHLDESNEHDRFAIAAWKNKIADFVTFSEQAPLIRLDCKGGKGQDPDIKSAKDCEAVYRNFFTAELAKGGMGCEFKKNSFGREDMYCGPAETKYDTNHFRCIVLFFKNGTVLANLVCLNRKYRSISWGAELLDFA